MAAAVSVTLDKSCLKISAIWQLVTGGVVVVAILVQGAVLASNLAASKTDWQCESAAKLDLEPCCIVGCNANTATSQEANSRPQGQALFHSPSDQVIACTLRNAGKEEERSIGRTECCATSSRGAAWKHWRPGLPRHLFGGIDAAQLQHHFAEFLCSGLGVAQDSVGP